MMKMYDKWLVLRDAMRARVLELHAHGMKTAHIAKEIGMTAQRVHKIIYPHGKPKPNGGKAKPEKAPVLVDMRVLASKGGKARAAKLSPERRSEIGRAGGKARAAKAQEGAA